jgi:hypothetical protein
MCWRFLPGLGIWENFPAHDRKAQLTHMAELLEDLYPAFRLYLYDGLARYSVPYTIFGTLRAAIYVGDMYLVLNAPPAIHTLTRHFDNLIRAATVNAHEAAGFARRPAQMPCCGERANDIKISLYPHLILKETP